MTKITYVDCDDYAAIYIDGILEDYTDRYNIDNFKYALDIGKKYPDSEFEKVYIDFDSWDGDILPKNLNEVSLEQ